MYYSISLLLIKLQHCISNSVIVLDYLITVTVSTVTTITIIVLSKTIKKAKHLILIIIIYNRSVNNMLAIMYLAQ